MIQKIATTLPFLIAVQAQGRCLATSSAGKMKRLQVTWHYTMLLLWVTTFFLWVCTHG